MPGGLFAQMSINDIYTKKMSSLTLIWSIVHRSSNTNIYNKKRIKQYKDIKIYVLLWLPTTQKRLQRIDLLLIRLGRLLIPYFNENLFLNFIASWCWLRNFSYLKPPPLKKSSPASVSKYCRHYRVYYIVVIDSFLFTVIYTCLRKY